MFNRQRVVVADMMRRYPNAVSCCYDYALALIALCTALSASRCLARPSTPPCTNQQLCYCSEHDARFWSKWWHHWLNFVLANQRVYRLSLYLYQWANCLVVCGVIEAGYQHSPIDAHFSTWHSFIHFKIIGPAFPCHVFVLAKAGLYRGQLYPNLIDNKTL